ncbi:MAG: hypothetical protein HGJ93_00730 [Desulfosarcina sp.]|nr:hypothetical protein [Desulfosarcina sp.]MBC2764511.1 hypothetical protein [Desulfosarcina sp.]
MNISDIIRSNIMEERYRRNLAAGRLTNRMDLQAQQFGGVKPETTIADLLDYERATGTEWPKRPVTVAEATGMQKDVSGGSPAVFNLPTEVIADWKPKQKRELETVESAAANKWAGKDAEWNEAQKRGIPGLTIGDVYGFSPAVAGESWGEPYQGPEGSWWQKSSSGKVSPLMGRPPAESDTETWDDVTTGPDGSYIQRSSSGKVASILGRPPAESNTGQNTEYQRLRQDVARKWGYNEFSKIDEDTARKIEEATVLARAYFDADPAKNMDTAIARANMEIRQKYQAADLLQHANPDGSGDWGSNETETIAAIQQMRASQWTDAEIQQGLLQHGWDAAKAADLMMKAGTPGVAGMGNDPLGLRMQ